ncbi:MAG: type II toxin-antitoxin system RelE/ParE family toxin [Pseudomonadota bacterium]
MVWRIEFDQAAKKELLKLDLQVARRILDFLHKRLLHVQDPRSLGEALRGCRLGNLWKYRVGDYRVIANIEDNVLCILVVRIGNRREVYR